MDPLITDTSLFISQAHDRARNLIKTGVWRSIELHRLNTWLIQFEQYDASLLGAVLLDNLIFKTRAQLLAMLEYLLICPQLCSGYQWDYELAEALARRKDIGVRLTPAISLAQPPTKSGPYILRLLQRHFRIRDEWLVWPQEIEQLDAGVKLLVIVDDFLGSGTQFSEFAKIAHLKQVNAARPEIRIVYLVAAAHEDGINELRQAFPFVEIVCADLLSASYHLFDSERLDAKYRVSITGLLRNQYLEIAGRAGLPLDGKAGPFGFGNQGLSYAFEHATPNNSLPIYWYSGSQHWNPVLDR
ncbi:phosphoribosyltransferase-like protein [Paraburkholderia sediminicola]|uniref:phosphoribosyltransferase-like protein n=1 Tax=Paraburkholderia sediminicola TaxID=458836 RepID=UPI0038BC4EEF